MSMAHNQERIYEALQAAGRPLSAYELLDRVRTFGISAPPTVYRALDRLVESGRAHRLESLNAYIACNAPDHQHDQAVFAICTDCGSVDEYDAPRIFASLKKLAKGNRFDFESAVIELKGRCGACGTPGSHT